jgi:hypothetical protein
MTTTAKTTATKTAKAVAAKPADVQPVDASTDSTKPARIDHSACAHPRTPKGRAGCRAARKAA